MCYKITELCHKQNTNSKIYKPQTKMVRFVGRQCCDTILLDGKGQGSDRLTPNNATKLKFSVQTFYSFPLPHSGNFWLVPNLLCSFTPYNIFVTHGCTHRSSSLLGVPAGILQIRSDPRHLIRRCRIARRPPASRQSDELFSTSQRPTRGDSGCATTGVLLAGSAVVDHLTTDLVGNRVSFRLAD